MSVSKWEWIARRLVGEYAHAVNTIICGDSVDDVLEDGDFLARALLRLRHIPHPSEVENPEDVRRAEDAAVLTILEAEYEDAKKGAK